MKKHITVYKKGYLSHHAIWAKLAIDNIIAVCSFDNGFKTIEVSGYDLIKTVKIIKMFSGAEIVNVSDSYFDAVEWRSNFWQEKTLINTFK